MLRTAENDDEDASPFSNSSEKGLNSYGVIEVSLVH